MTRKQNYFRFLGLVGLLEVLGNVITYTADFMAHIVVSGHISARHQHLPVHVSAVLLLIGVIVISIGTVVCYMVTWSKRDLYNINWKGERV